MMMMAVMVGGDDVDHADHDDHDDRDAGWW
jgi:hypothetical protein